MSKYLYCRDEEVSKQLLTNFKLLNVINDTEGKIHIFRYDDAVGLDFSNIDIKNSCVIKDKSIMTFKA